MFEAGCSLFHAQCRSTCSLFHTQMPLDVEQLRPDRGPEARCTCSLAACTSAGAAAAVAPAANVHEGAAFRVGYLMALRCFVRSSVVPAAVPVHGLGGGGNGR